MQPQQKLWLRVIGIIELLLASLMGFLLLLGLVPKAKVDNHPDASYEITMIIVFLLPIFIILSAMGITAYRQHESAGVMQLLGWVLIVAIPLLLFF